MRLKLPKSQFHIIEILLEGKRLLHPHAGAAIFKRAERQTKTRTEQPGLSFASQPAPAQTRLPGRDFSNTPLLDAEEGDGDT